MTLKKSIKTKVINLKASNKTDKQILSIIPSIGASSVSKIVKENRSTIQAKKEKYLKLIDKLTGGDKIQANQLSKCLNAKTEVYNFKGEVVGIRDDYKQILDTIKYLDKLKGRDTINNVQLKQTNNYISQELDKYIK